EAGVAQPCTDTVKHRGDTLDVFVSGSRVGFGLHAFNADTLSSDYLGTHCAGPTEEDMVAAQVLPAVGIPLSVMKRQRIDFGLDRERERPGPRVLRRHGEVPEHAHDGKPRKELVGLGAVRAFVVAVLDHERPGLASHMIVGAGLGRPGAAEVGLAAARRRRWA